MPRQYKENPSLFTGLRQTTSIASLPANKSPSGTTMPQQHSHVYGRVSNTSLVVPLFYSIGPLRVVDSRPQACTFSSKCFSKANSCSAVDTTAANVHTCAPSPSSLYQQKPSMGRAASGTRYPGTSDDGCRRPFQVISYVDSGGSHLSSASIATFPSFFR
jgi:hypothetical protein